MLDLDYIRSRRDSLGLSFAEAAKLAGWGEKARGHWYDIESGKKPNPTLKTLVEMAAVLKCSPGKLIK
jgi:transcriptional regulator with XRE-family HTH domain